MSLIIKGMKLPENDGMKELVIGRAPNGTEPIAIVSGDITEFYKVIEIPTPHGRLIDADNVSSDAMCSHCVEEYCRNNCECFIENVQTILSNELITPTIIEAEVSE